MTYIQENFNDMNINFFGCDIIKGHCDLINFQTLILSDQAWLVNTRAY
jgi:cephalosporin hydroxylase